MQVIKWGGGEKSYDNFKLYAFRNPPHLPIIFVHGAQIITHVQPAPKPVLALAPKLVLALAPKPVLTSAPYPVLAVALGQEIIQIKYC